MAYGAATKTGLAALYMIKFQNGLSFEGLEDSPFYLRVTRDTSFSERHKERTVTITPGNSGSSNFVKALNARGPSTTCTFQLDTKPDYVVGSIDNKIITSQNKAQIKDAFIHELETKGYIHGQMIQRKLWGYQGGSLGYGSVTVGGSTITVATITQANQFWAGQVIELTTDDGSSVSPSGTVYGPYTVASVDPATRVVTVNEVIDAPTASYYVFFDGEYGLNFTGILGWNPPTAPGADLFLGVNRTAYGDLRRTSGFRPTRILADHTRNVAEACAEAKAIGINPRDLFVNPKDLDKWIAEMPNPQWVERASTFANVNYEGVVIRTASGVMTAVAEPKCPEGIWFATRMPLWTLRSQGEVPMKVGKGDLSLETSADAWQFRIISYACLDCVDPGQSITGRWAA